ncbi:MAG TPA: DUF882 domain-containing protein [Candidatus Binatia bacterium]|nr:DUF882 domain-containing protein [Candidatus Binatia bacterium]
MCRLAAAATLALALPCAAAPARFFVEGGGTLAIENAHTGARASVRYRRADGTYDPGALARLERVFRSGDGREAPIALRLVEVLGWLQERSGGRPLVLMSGYRSPDYNAGLRARGRQVAGGSLHTEGLAADLAFPRAALRPLWLRVRALGCCGAGYYAEEGFLHVDVGRPRFWEAATSRVDENLSAGNARLFARTEFDRYAAGEPIAVALHALTVPPVRLARTATLIPERGAPAAVPLAAGGEPGEGCLAAEATGAEFRVPAAPARGRARLVLRTCEPRVERTPETVETNPIEVR